MIVYVEKLKDFILFFKKELINDFNKVTGY